MTRTLIIIGPLYMGVLIGFLFVFLIGFDLMLVLKFSWYLNIHQTKIDRIQTVVIKNNNNDSAILFNVPIHLKLNIQNWHFVYLEYFCYKSTSFPPLFTSLFPLSLSLSHLSLFIGVPCGQWMKVVTVKRGKWKQWGSIHCIYRTELAKGWGEFGSSLGLSQDPKPQQGQKVFSSGFPCSPSDAGCDSPFVVLIWVLNTPQLRI